MGFKERAVVETILVAVVSAREVSGRRGGTVALTSWVVVPIVVGGSIVPGVSSPPCFFWPGDSPRHLSPHLMGRFEART